MKIVRVLLVIPYVLVTNLIDVVGYVWDYLNYKVENIATYFMRYLK